ncbi:MAG TPA: hypothetical protein VHK24_11900, partial [Steroidobacter sp.]|nr:hypothetical protein [Steroidobacter sp.]
LALSFDEHKKNRRNKVASLPSVWIGSCSDAGKHVARKTLSLVVFDAPCLFRESSVRALERAGIPWRLGLTTPSLGGVWAGVRAGLGVSARTPIGVPSYLAILQADCKLPKLPPVDLLIHCADEPRPAVKELRDMLYDAAATKCRELVGMKVGGRLSKHAAHSRAAQATSSKRVV